MFCSYIFSSLPYTEKANALLLFVIIWLLVDTFLAVFFWSVVSQTIFWHPLLQGFSFFFMFSN